MIKYVVKRILLMMLTLFVILSLCFIFIKLLPLPPVSGSEATVQRVEERRELMGYYKPLIEQFFLFWKRIFTQFDWGMGENMYPVQEVTKIIGEKLPATSTVNLYSLLISIPVGLLLGIYAAVKKNKWQDHTISVAVMLFISVPSFGYPFLVQYLLCYKLQWFPMVAEKGLSLTDPKMIWSLMPAVISLAFGTIAQLTRYTRAELSEVLTSEFMLLARTKGLTRRQATMRHALRNSMVPIFPMILGEFIGILSGSLVIESIYNIPGIGALYVQSVNSLDYNFFMAISAFYTAIGLAAGIIIDLSYGFIDPRIRMGVK